jgi:hypothetical protein
VISGFSETSGSLLYVVVNYLAGTDLITSVSDGGFDQFAYVAGEFAPAQSVAFYDVTSDHGGTLTIVVTISNVEFGTCRAGELAAGTEVGSVGTGNNTLAGTLLDVSNPAAHSPSLVLAIIGSDRPSGAYAMPTPNGNWLTGGQQGTGWNPGTESALYAYNDTGTAPVTFGFVCGSAVSISGIAVEFYSGTTSGTSASSSIDWGWVLIGTAVSAIAVAMVAFALLVRKGRGPSPPRA